jgi:hypothetical protein
MLVVAIAASVTAAVPGIHLVRPGSCELRLNGGGVGGLRAPLAGLAGLAQQLVEGGHRAEVGPLVQQRRPDFVGDQVSEPLAVQRMPDRRSFRWGQARGWTRSACGTGAGFVAGGLIRCRRYQVACATPAAAHAARVPILGASRVIASSVLP